MSSSAGKRLQSSTWGHGWPWQARTGAQLSLTATQRLWHGWIKLKADQMKDYKLKTKREKYLREERVFQVSGKTYLSRQTGAMREQRKAWACGWQPVCNRGLQSSERGTTSPSRLLWPKKLGSRISEYPTPLQTLIWLGMVTQRVDWPMSNASRGDARARRAVKYRAMVCKIHKMESWGLLSPLLLLLPLYTGSSASPISLQVCYQQSIKATETTCLETIACFVRTADREGALGKWRVCEKGRGGINAPLLIAFTECSFCNGS